MIGQTLGHYHILEQIGAGGMGVVFRAHDERLDRDVAIKFLPPGAVNDEPARKRFRKEALTVSNLNHPNIATIYDFDSQEGVDFLVMELISGETLDEKLSAGPLPEKEILRLATQMVEGLAAAHAHGVAHRDLKPGNLRVTPDGRLKILDFGLAKLFLPASPTAATGSLSQSQALSGTLPYMAPEQLLGEKVDGRTDIHAVGTVLYEMATGKRPFTETQSSRLTDSILHQAPVSPRAVNARVSTELERMILKCLEKAPENRYQSARELEVDLRRLGASASSHAGGAAAKSRSSRRIPLIVAATALIALVMLLSLLNPGHWRDRLPHGSKPEHIESLAVLPLANLSGDPAQDYFADAMTEQLTTDLAQISSLRVISRTSAMNYKGAKKPLPQIARELNVDGVVEGSVQRSGQQVRITAQLMYGPTDQHMWAKTYERPLQDVLALENELAAEISKEVGGTLNPQQQVRLASTRQVNPESYELYLKGSSYFDEFDLLKSVDYLNQAIKLDPNYAASYAKMAEDYYFLGFFNLMAPNVAFPRMKDAALKALERDENLAAAHGALALVKLHYDWDFPGAEKEFKRALELNPNDADIRHDYSHYLIAMGRLEESATESDRALQLDPVDTGLRACLCWHRYSARQYGESVAQALKAIQAEPDDSWSHIILGWDYEQQGRFEEAISELQTAVKLFGDKEFALAALGHAYALAGKKQQTEEVLAKLKNMEKHGYVSAFDMAVIYTGAGDKEKALQWLEKAFEERSSFLIYSRWEPRLDPLRSDPRFQALLRRIGLPN
jgi:serine/threonine protein kinase/Flp pilus assembly protein TadD